MNKPGESTLSVLEEHQLLEITNDSSLKSMFGAVKGSGQHVGMRGSLSQAGLCFSGGTENACRAPGVQVVSLGGSSSLEHLDTLGKDKVVVFLKGMPEQLQCRFSNAMVQIPQPTMC